MEELKMLGSRKYTLSEIAKEIKRIDDNCQTSKYSLTDVDDLQLLAVELKRHAREISQCCN